MLKQELIAESTNLEIAVELDSVFESVELSPEVKANFSTVFEAAVKKGAATLAEKRINAIAEKAEEKVKEKSEEAEEKAEKKITEAAAKFFDHLAVKWMAENQLAVDRGIKADLFESMLGGMKELFVEHNVVIPEEAVDVVAEMEEELAEQKEATAKLFEEVTKQNEYINYVQREVAVNEAVRELTESQKEKVSTLIEGMSYSDEFSGKLNAIVEMVKGSSEKPAAVNESINTVDNEASGLNFVTEAVVEPSTPAQSSSMAAYLAGAKRLS
ncbi:head scaffolding protein [Citrobacter phage CF1 ERZ-2017]|uniref:Prohead core scaffold protein n=1 Tax=Citrobacter phage CF1 ERZ-2017 TaxID=2267236 RepID=A0A2H4YFW2_9CAUD|nr:head scaffolding protein [Citrobacter phage CF1 ERZ-2017]AUE23068.1 prohead core scaffold protein [Citrobacter phage CF1 ERZ-2017]